MSKGVNKLLKKLNLFLLHKFTVLVKSVLIIIKYEFRVLLQSY
jgi:hypothetical protein